MNTNNSIPFSANLLRTLPCTMDDGTFTIALDMARNKALILLNFLIGLNLTAKAAKNQDTSAVFLGLPPRRNTPLIAFQRSRMEALHAARQIRSADWCASALSASVLL